MAEEYKKISDLAEMLASDINGSTKMVVTTGELKSSRNLNVSDLVVGNLSTDSNYRALSAGMGKKLNDEKAPVLNPIFTGTVSGVTKAMVGLSNVDNTADASKPISAATQIALNSKVSAENAVFTGVANFEGDVQVSEDIIVDGNVRSYSNTVDTKLQFGPSATIKIQTGVSGGTPIYREFPATELASSDLNGTSYVMVYGAGTPEDNAAEFRAAYTLAKIMPRYLGEFDGADTIGGYEGQIGQTFKLTNDNTYRRITSIFDDALVYGAQGFETITEAEARATRTTIIMAPGIYKFGTASIGATAKLIHDTTGIDIVSLTGDRDVFVDGIGVTAQNTYLKGITCNISSSGTQYPFGISTGLDKLICENCEGGSFSFGFDAVNEMLVPGTFINCKGGSNSFASGGSALGLFIDCEAGDNSFAANGGASGEFINCKAGGGSFGSNNSAHGIFTNCVGGNASFGGGTGSIAGGVFTNCIGGNGSFGSVGFTSGSHFYYCQGGPGSNISGGQVVLYCSVNNSPIANTL